MMELEVALLFHATLLSHAMDHVECMYGSARSVSYGMEELLVPIIIYLLLPYKRILEFTLPNVPLSPPQDKTLGLQAPWGYQSLSCPGC